MLMQRFCSSVAWTLFIFVVVWSTGLGASLEVENGASLESGAAPVKLLVCVEALCIDSKRFMLEQLYPTYQKLGSEVIDLDLVVSGNVRMEEDQQSFSCQHGGAECDANTYEQCAVHLYPHEPSQSLDFVYCLFTKLRMGYRTDPFPNEPFQSCATESGMDFAALSACHDDPTNVWQLEKQAFDKTPTHNFIPFVVIDQVDNFDVSRSLLDAVCDVYTASGGSHPACDA